MARKVQSTRPRGRQATPAPNFLYIEVRQYADSPASFDTIKVYALDRDDAYTTGSKMLTCRQDIQAKKRHGVLLPTDHAAGRFLNDYVVEL